MKPVGNQTIRRKVRVGASPLPTKAGRTRTLNITGEAIEHASLVFDPEWYVRQYPDIGAAGVDPVQHFLTMGFAEGRNPNAFFDCAWYVQSYPDVAAHGQNPFMHYLFYGAREGRKPREGA